MKRQDSRTYLNSKRVRKEILNESYHSPLRQGEHVREEPFSVPVIFKTSLSARILSIPNLYKVKVSAVKPFDGSYDLAEHIASYRAHMAVSMTCEAMLCKFFPTTLSGIALNWYTALPPGSVDSFASLESLFLDQFVAAKRQRKSNLHLMSVIQREGEYVTSYIQRFREEVLSILGANNATTVPALINDVRTPKLKWKLLEHDLLPTPKLWR